MARGPPPRWSRFNAEDGSDLELGGALPQRLLWTVDRRGSKGLYLLHRPKTHCFLDLVEEGRKIVGDVTHRLRAEPPPAASALGDMGRSLSFGSYNKTYGSLGAIIGFMTWM